MLMQQACSTSVLGTVQMQHSPVAVRKAAFCRLDRGHVTNLGGASGVCPQDIAPPWHCLQPRLVCWGEGRAVYWLLRDDALKTFLSALCHP